MEIEIKEEDDLSILDSFINLEIENKKQDDLSILDSFLNLKIEISDEYMNYAMQRVYNDIALLKALLVDPPKEFIEDGNLKLLNSLASEVVSIISDFHLNTVDHDVAAELGSKLRCIKLSDHLSDFIWKGKSYLVVPRSLRIFPIIGKLEFVDHLVENLKELVIAKADLIAPLKFIILKLIEKLHFLSSLLMVLSQEQKEQPHVKQLLKLITTSAYEVEWTIDYFMVKELPIWYYLSLLIDRLNLLQNFEGQLRTELGDMPVIKSRFSEFMSNGFILIINTWVQESHIILLQHYNREVIKKGYKVHSWCVCSSYRERKKEVFLQLLQNVSVQQSGVAYDPKIRYTSDMSQDELERSVRELYNIDWSYIMLEDVQDIDTVQDIIRVLPYPGYFGIIQVATCSPEFPYECGYPLQKFLCNKYSQVRPSKSATNLRSILTDYDGGDVVGFKEEMGTMLELLIQGPTKLHLISIFGMAGLGKTTLAKKLYNDRSVIEHFDRRAWCYVSQVYETKKLLLEILGHFVQLSDTIRVMDDGELADLLCKNLLGRRFLIVLDDIWSTRAWNDLKRCFPDGNKSRIIFTTRLQELVTEAQSGSVLQPLSYLSENESWELLSKKLFEKESCPEELSEVGTQIAKRCQGLPISIVLVAGVLTKMEKTKHRWTQILESLTSCILGGANEHGKGIIEMSYRHLPDYLKPCFLYCGHFLRDREVPVSKLIRMLIAEQLIRHSELKSLENVAEDCLMDLISRSLVTVSKEKSKGGFKSCRVHDLIHEFCFRKAGEEKFISKVRYIEDLSPAKNNSMGPTLSRCEQSVCIMMKKSRQAIRSMSIFPPGDGDQCFSFDLSLLIPHWKLLTKLNVEFDIGESFDALMVLVHLRYLAVQGYIDCIPSSIANLWKLETFLVKTKRAKVVEVPDAICDMVKLRHVHINRSASFKLDPSRSEESSILNNLQTLSTPILTHGGNMEKILRKVKGINKLKCIFFLESWDDTTNCNKFPKLGFLSQLVSLKVSYYGVGMPPCEFEFPSNLTKLTLLYFRKPWSEISQLAKLNNLEVLKLLSNAFKGEAWKMEDEVFSKLKFLKLDTLDIEEWTADNDNFPHLEHVVLNQCEKLEDIPSSIGAIDTLKMIEVKWCKQSVAVSAREIQDEQMEYGNVVKIHVHPDVSY